jgi:hypothetical protein
MSIAGVMAIFCTFTLQHCMCCNHQPQTLTANLPSIEAFSCLPACPILAYVCRVGENNGIRFPREFALLIKQLLYFDRYNRILAPQLKVFDDKRINLRQVDLDYELN